MRSLFPLLLASLAAPVAAQPAFPKGPTIQIAMTDHGYVPSMVSLRAGRPYTLRFVNRSGRGHDFTSNAFLGQARVSPRDQYVLRDNKVDLDPGQSATLRIVAPDVHGARFEFHSQHLTDAASGLKGNIYVR